MSTRTSLELHPDGCRLVEVHVGSGRARAATAGEVRVRAFEALPGITDTAAFTRQLAALRTGRKLKRDAWVTIWGLRSAQQFLRLPPARPGDLEALAAREARKEIAPLEADGDRATLGIMLGAEVMIGPQRRREVSMVAASTAEIQRRIQPITDAGFVVDGVLTPAVALTAVARAQHGIAQGSAGAYVALTARATCVAIVRDGLLLFAREMPWGHEPQADPDGVGARLASELRRSVLFFKQTFRASVDHVVLCGDMPNIRGLTAPLGEALGAPVQTLDSLSGIDASAVPAPADRFRSEVAAFRLGIAVGAEPSPPANLLPSAIRANRRSRARAVRLGASAAAGFGLVLGGYLFVGRAAARYEAERSRAEQQLATLEPEAQRRERERQAHALAAAQRAALAAFDSQGPRLTRLLEALSGATPPEIVLTAIKAETDAMQWNTTVTGIAVTPDAASGQAAVNALLRSLAASPFAGAPVQPPSFRVVSGTGAAAAGGDPRAVPDGMSGVEFVVQLRMAK